MYWLIKETIIYKRFSQVSDIVTADLYSFHGINALKAILNVIDRYEIDIINCHSGRMMPICLLIKKFRNIKLVLYKHNATRAKNDLYHKYVRKNTDAIICVSNLVYQLQTEGLDLADKLKFHIVHNGIMLERFNKYKESQKLREKFVVGYAGRITENKGIDILLKAIRLLHLSHSDVVFHLVGADEDNYIDILKREVQINGMENYVTYNGLERDMERFYKSIDVLVLPSLVREAFGLVICEAMYCGVIVVTSNSGAQSEIIDNGKDGIIIERITPEDVCTCLDGLYKSFDKLDYMRSAAKIKVKMQFSISKTVDGIMNICKMI